MMRIVARDCPECLQMFTPKRSARIYCSLPCSEKATSRRVRPPSTEERSIAKAAYFAGLIDGEGHISMRIRSGDRNCQRKYIYIAVNMTCERTVQALAEYFGGNYKSKKVAARHKPQWVWKATTAAARAVLVEIRPYLITKAAIADEVIAYTATRHPGGYHAHFGNGQDDRK